MLKPKLSPLLSNIKNLKHGFFTRQGGVSQGDFSSLNLSSKPDHPFEHLAENKKRVEAFLQAPLVMAKQVHGCDVRRVQGPHDTLTVDGLVTQLPQVGLGVLTADCVPVLWVEPKTHTIAVSHAGWPGALAGIIENTRQFFTYPPLVVVGPSIQQQSYEVGEDVYEKFLDKDLGSSSFFKPYNKLYLFDLPGYVYNLIKTLDVQAIDWICEDTYTMPDTYFSYRRSTHEGKKTWGNMVSAVAWIDT